MDRIADGSIDAIWSSHNLEHLADPEVPRALVEFLRVLRPGGVAWIALPDVQSLAERIASGELDAPTCHSSAGPISAAGILWGHRAALAAGRTWMAHRTGFSAATLERHPQDWRVRLELALVCFAQQRLEEAVVELGQVVVLEPRLARAQLALGTFLAMLGRQPEALRLDPGHGLAAMNLGRIRYEQGHPLEGLTLCRTALSTVAEPSLHSNLPMMMNFTAGVDDGAVMEAHHAFDRRIVEPLAAEILPPLAPAPPEGRLRLGYVSRDLRRHSLRYFLLPIFEHHDHGAFEIVCYFDAEDGDEVTDRFRALARSLGALPRLER